MIKGLQGKNLFGLLHLRIKKIDYSYPQTSSKAPKAVWSVCYPILIRSMPNPLFEKTDKMLWIFEPEFVRDLADRFATVKNAFFNTNAGYGVGSGFRTVKEFGPNSKVLEGFSIQGRIERPFIDY